MNKEKGFTLIELLIVVAIIGILAAIAIPQFNKYKERAARSTAVSDAKNLATEIEAYYADYGSYPNSTEVTEGNPAIIGSNTFSLSDNNKFDDYASDTDGYYYRVSNSQYEEYVEYNSTGGGADASTWDID